MRQRSSETIPKEEFLIQLRDLIYTNNSRKREKLNGFLDHLAALETPFAPGYLTQEPNNPDAEWMPEMKELLNLAIKSLKSHRIHKLAVNKLKVIYLELAHNIEPGIILQHEFERKFIDELPMLENTTERSRFLLSLSCRIRSVLCELLDNRTVDTYKETDVSDLFIIAEQLDFLGRCVVTEEKYDEAKAIIEKHWTFIAN